MSAWVSLPQQRVMTTWNKQTTNILARKPVAGKSSERPQTAKLNCRDFFYLEDFVGGIGIMLLKFTSALDFLMVEVSESHPLSSNFVQLALVIVCPSPSLAGLVSSSSFNHSSWLQCDPRSLRVKDLVQCWTCAFQQIFVSLASSKTKMGKTFSCVFVLT